MLERFGLCKRQGSHADGNLLLMDPDGFDKIIFAKSFLVHALRSFAVITNSSRSKINRLCLRQWFIRRNREGDLEFRSRIFTAILGSDLGYVLILIFCTSTETSQKCFLNQ